MFRDKAGIIHESAGSYGANSLVVCEMGTPDLDLRGLTQVYDGPVTCLRCIGSRWAFVGSR
jgi:hypothetical protein